MVRTMANNTAPALTEAPAVLGNDPEDDYYFIYFWDLLTGYTDADGDLLAVSDLTVDHGTLRPSDYGSGFVFYPLANFNGTVNLNYKVIDSKGGITAATQSFVVLPVKDDPALTGTQTTLSAGAENTPYIVSAADLLTGFSDADGDALSISFLNANHGTVADNGDGTFTVTPFNDYHGDMTLSYGVDDGNGGSIYGLQSFNLVAANDAPSFGTGDGKVFLDRGIGSSLALQADGKILLVGTNTEGYHQFSLTRLNVDGSLDKSFFDHGKLLVYLGEFAKGRDIAVQADGTIFLAGYSALSPLSATGIDFAVVRIGRDGTVGAVIQPVNTKIDSAADEGSCIALQADGKILVAGTIQTFVAGSPEGSDFGIIRLNVDGSLDTSFGQGGKVIQGLGALGLIDVASDIAMQANGKIVVVGSAWTAGEQDDFGVIRLNMDGSLDNTFGNGGKLQLDVGGRNLRDWANSVLIQPDGKLLIAGTSWDGSDENFSLVRLNSDGSLDRSFDADGKLLVDVGAESDNGESVTLLADGKILVAGYSHRGGTEASGGFDFSVIRLNSDGSLDKSFNGSGKVVIPSGTYSIQSQYSYANGAYSNTAHTVAVQDDGKILLGGLRFDGSGSDQGVIRLNADGSLDTTFGLNILNGIVSYDFGGTPVVLDSDVTIYDEELVSNGNFSGASLTLSRHGGADIHDIFSASGNLRFSDGHAFLSDVDIGTVNSNGGILAIAFGANATQAQVNEVLSSIAFANDYIDAPTSIQLDWIFSDGNIADQGLGGALEAYGFSTVNIIDNHSPTLNEPITDQFATIGIAYTYTLPDHAFIDFDLGDILSYSAIQVNGNVLPAWLSFDSSTCTFYGTPTSADNGDLSIRITAADAFSASASDVFNIHVTHKITGTAGNNILGGTSGNDVIEALAGDDLLDGAAGIDTAVFSGQRDSYTLIRTTTGFTVQDDSGSDGTDNLTAIERLQFADRTLAFDLDGTAGQVYRLYQAALNRTPDMAGLGYWIEGMDNGMTLTLAGSGFINSAEFQSLYGSNPSNAQFVNLLYENVLHRDPDTAGFDYWDGELSRGLSREQVLIGFSESTENKLALMAFDMDGSMGQVYRLYKAALNRAPDAGGLDSWTRGVDHGMTLEQAASGFIQSAEFQSLYGSNPTNAQFVDLLYENVPHRDPDTAGYNAWMNGLANGLSREEALVGFSESTENKLALVGIVQDGISFV